MPEFEVTVVTTRAGTHSIRLNAPDAAPAQGVVQAECRANQCHCPPDWCTDDVQSDVVSVREVELRARIGLPAANLKSSRSELERND
jgi:hypothetical protein